MADLNSICIIGNIAKDIVLKKTQTGRDVANVVVACNRRKDSTGNEKTDFINVEAWNSSAKYLADYAKKGTKISVHGSLRIDSWQDGTVWNNRSYILSDSVNIIANGRSNGSMEAPDISDDSLPF